MSDLSALPLFAFLSAPPPAFDPLAAALAARDWGMPVPGPVLPASVLAEKAPGLDDSAVLAGFRADRAAAAPAVVPAAAARADAAASRSASRPSRRRAAPVSAAAADAAVAAFLARGGAVSVCPTRFVAPVAGVA